MLKSPRSPKWISEYEAARTRVAWFKRDDRAVTALGGKDRVTFLHGMITNDMKKLPSGGSVLASMLSAKGKLLADLVVHNLGETLWLETDKSQRNSLDLGLQKYVLGSQVTFSSLEEEVALYNLFGPGAQELAAKLTIRPTFSSVLEDPVNPTISFFVPVSKSTELESEFASFGAMPISLPVYEALRIEAGIPRYGVDVNEDHLLQEVPFLAKGVSYTKGCYIGQETVARLHARGENVARRLMGLSMEEAYPVGTHVLFGDKNVGKVTSVTFSPCLHDFLGLTIIHREAFEPGTIVMLPSSRAKVVTLPLA